LIKKILLALNWLPHYIAREVSRSLRSDRVIPKHVYFCVCDHFEPYWNGADSTTARKRVQRWLTEYPKLADNYRDSDGNILKYSFFYPEEEYRETDLQALAGLCHAGYGTVEIHLHHDNDTADNLRRTLVDYKHRLYEKHGLLSKNKKTGEIQYGFIHGNWALNNSRPDGRWCGVNNETSILLETGCYADFTFPSAPSNTQTRKVNSIYYGVDCPGKPKSHDWGVNAKVGRLGEGLLMVQGPLGLNFKNRKFGLIPRIENGGFLGNLPPSRERLKLWINVGVHVQGAPEHVFVKLYTHGAQDGIMRMLFDNGGLKAFFEEIKRYEDESKICVHFVSARELVQKVEMIREGSI
jgi:hypothetical protein